MRHARIESFRSELGIIVVIGVAEGAELSPYELDHLGDVMCSYLSVIGFDSVIGPRTARPHMTDQELEEELDDFDVVPRADLSERITR